MIEMKIDEESYLHDPVCLEYPVSPFHPDNPVHLGVLSMNTSIVDKERNASDFDRQTWLAKRSLSTR